jgi:hypothetical protein
MIPPFHSYKQNYLWIRREGVGWLTQTFPCGYVLSLNLVTIPYGCVNVGEKKRENTCLTKLLSPPLRPKKRSG